MSTEDTATEDSEQHRLLDAVERLLAQPPARQALTLRRIRLAMKSAPSGPLSSSAQRLIEVVLRDDEKFAEAPGHSIEVSP